VPAVRVAPNPGYGCLSQWKEGPTVCANALVGRMDAIDAEVLAMLQDDILRPSIHLSF
jgi:hypothetical protein